MIAGTLEIQLLANLARLQKDMSEAKSMVGGAMQSITRAVEVAKTAIAGFGAGLSVVGLARVVQNAAEAADQLYKMSQKTGIAVAELSALKYAATLSDVSLESLGKGMKGLSQKMVEAGDATGKAGRLMAAMGVDVKGGAAPAVEKLADVFAKLPDGPTKAALAVEVFGKAGMDMIPLLNQGSDGLRKMRDEALRLGLVMDEETAKAAEQFNDNMKVVTMSSERLGQSLLNSLAPSMVRISQAMKEAAAESGTLAAIWVGLGGLASEALGLNQTEAERTKKQIREIQAEIAKLRTIEATDLGGGVYDRARMVQAQARIAVLQDELRLVQQLQIAQSGGYDDQASRAARQGRGVSGGVDTALETRIRGILGLKDGAEKAAKAMKDLGLADAHVTQYLKIQAELEAAVAKAIEDGVDARRKAIDAIDEQIARAKWENDTLGMTREQVAALVVLRLEEKQAILVASGAMEDEIAQLQQEIDKRKDLKKVIATGEELRARKKADEDYLTWFAGQWDIVGQNVSNGFTSMFSGMLEGTLNSWEDWAKSLGQIFKRTVVDFAGSAMNQLFRNLSTAISSGNFSNLMGGVNPFGLAAAGGGFIGSGITNALGSGQRGAQLGTQLGSAGAMAGFAVAGPVGAIVGAVVGGLAGHFSDPDGLAQRGATFGPRARATNPTQFGFRSAFGDFSVSDTRWFSDSDMGPTLRQFLAGLGAGDDRIAGLLNPAERDRVAAALQTSRGYSFGEEHGDFSAALGEITLDRMRLIFEAIDPTLTKLLEGFTGTNEELINFVTGILGVRSALDNFPLKGLTIDSLNAWKQGGESVVDTFNRVSGQWAEFSAMFRTEGEQMADAQTMLSEGFAALGIAAPATKEEFYNLVAGLDLSTESGRKFFDGLMKLAPAFNTVASAAEAAVARFNSLASTLSPTFGAANARSVLEARVRTWMGLSPGNGAAGGWDVESTIGNIGTLIREGRLGEALTYAQSLGGNAVNVLNDMLEAYIAWQNATSAGANPLTPVIRGVNDLGDAATRAAAQMQGAKDGLWSYLQGLFVNPSLSPLGPREQLTEARRQFYEQLRLAQGGDVGAASGLQGYIDRVLNLGRAGSGSGSDFIRLFREITSAAADFARPGGAQDLQRDIYAEQRTGNDIMREVRQILIDIRDRGTADGENVAGAVENAALSTAMR